MLDGGGQIVGTDVEDLGGGLDAQRVSLAQPTVDVNPPASALGGHVRLPPSASPVLIDRSNSTMRRIDRQGCVTFGV